MSKPSGEASTAPPAAQIAVESLGKRFGAKTILDGIDLNIEAGSFVAIVGKSGCGKSTLLRLVAGLTEPSTGRISIGGETLRGRNLEARMMFQDARLLPWRRVVDNVCLGAGDRWRDRAEELLHQVGLFDRGHDWPSILSGGERQRVALARALLPRPRILLLDEPLGALDALTRIEMQDLIEQLWLEEQCTSLLVTHDVEEAVVLADRVLIIDSGKVAVDVSVELPRPRDRAGIEFARLKATILEAVLGQSTARALPAARSGRTV